MAQTKPFRRNARPFIDGEFQNDGKGRYLKSAEYAQDGRRYIRAALLLQSDLLRVFEFVEPDEKNCLCYSFRIHELIVRTCIEIEANFKAILRENAYNRSGDWNIVDYRKIEPTHLLSHYRVKVPDFLDPEYTFSPFFDWMDKGKPDWHTAYNVAKHDRHRSFEQANFGDYILEKARWNR